MLVVLLTRLSKISLSGDDDDDDGERGRVDDGVAGRNDGDGGWAVVLVVWWG